MEDMEACSGCRIPKGLRFSGLHLGGGKALTQTLDSNPTIAGAARALASFKCSFSFSTPFACSETQHT